MSEHKSLKELEIISQLKDHTPTFESFVRTLSFKDIYYSIRSVESAISVLEIQKNSRKSSPSKIIGVDLTLDILKKLPPKNNVIIKGVCNENWSGNIFICSDSEVIVGIALIEKKLSGYETPPKWDGSLEMLQEHNKNK